MKITILGAGNTGMALACHLASKSLVPLVYTRSSMKAEVWNKQGIIAEDKIIGNFPVKVTSNLKEAVEYGDIIIVTTLVNVHRSLIEDITPYLRRGQSLLIYNGCWGALEAYTVLKKHSKQDQVTIAETANMPYIASLAKDYRSVQIKGIKEMTVFAARGSKLRIEEFLTLLYSKVEEANSFVLTSMGSTNPIIHAVGSLFNITRIEQSEPFLFFGKPMTPKVVNFIEKTDEERILLGTALGVQLTPLLESLNSFWPEKRDNLYEALTLNPSYQTAVGPSILEHRYISEDFPCGILSMRALGDIMGVAMPYTTALAQVLSLYLDIMETKQEQKEKFALLDELTERC